MASTPRTRRNPRTAAVVAALAMTVLLAACYSSNQTKMVGLINESRRHHGKAALSANQAASQLAVSAASSSGAG